jgi:hypothetical protein
MNPCKKPTFTKAEGTGSRGTASMRWLDNIEQYTQILGIEGWKTKCSTATSGRTHLRWSRTELGLKYDRRVNKMK